eukprot:9311308-Pyramimonas_sp.AAC.1
MSASVVNGFCAKALTFQWFAMRRNVSMGFTLDATSCPTSSSADASVGGGMAAKRARACMNSLA